MHLSGTFPQRMESEGRTSQMSIIIAKPIQDNRILLEVQGISVLRMGGVGRIESIHIYISPSVLSSVTEVLTMLHRMVTVEQRSACSGMSSATAVNCSPIPPAISDI
jgi:hypothetical protein